MLLGFIIIIVLNLLLTDVFFFLHDKYVRRELIIVNKRRERESDENKKEFKPLELKDLKSRLTDVVFPISLFSGTIYVFFVLKNNYNFWLYLKDCMLYGILIFLIYLNLKLFITRGIRIVKQIKGDF